MGIMPWNNAGASVEAGIKRSERAAQFSQFLMTNMSKYDKGDGFLNEALIAEDLNISRGEVREKYRDMVEDLIDRTSKATETFDYMVHNLKKKLMPEYRKKTAETVKAIQAELTPDLERLM